jgi:putative membrane protein
VERHPSAPPETPEPRRSWRGVPRLLATGFAMGSADIVPGVSGGTVAFVAGIYAELLQSIKTVTSTTLGLLARGRIREAFASVPFGFLLPLGAGILVAGFSLASAISWLLRNEPVLVWAFFFGLVSASVILVLKRGGKLTGAGLALLAVSAAAAYALTTATGVETPASPIAFFLSGAVAACAMILPGISGSFLLVILGKYEQVLNAVADRDIITLLPLFLGAALGIGVFSRLLTYLLVRYYNLVIMALAGLMVGSLPRIWPWKDVEGFVPTAGHDDLALTEISQRPNVLPSSFDLETAGALLLIAAGGAVIWLVDYLGRWKAAEAKRRDEKGRLEAQEGGPPLAKEAAEGTTG